MKWRGNGIVEWQHCETILPRRTCNCMAHESEIGHKAAENSGPCEFNAPNFGGT